ncbi:serine hydrolase [Amycolatopsis suaedae]|uniref:Beta-lactamase class A catalytic domain-containing protein n=1 Tax=Amycolatopsis suaedae TaxID=2510978 RepID=A0A4Q7IY79_9PSEU|nr:serine hydrolase [Amycolatopsis suaedae]RZQ59921.1 hypothetical protein EWH70_31310 [Amycolatopsis suaedae]
MRPRVVLVSLLAVVVTAAALTVVVSALPRDVDGHPPEVAADPGSATPEPAPVAPSSSPTPLPAGEQAELATRVRGAVDEVTGGGGELGLAVFDRLTESTVATIAGDEWFYSASVSKLLIAVDLLLDQPEVDEAARQNVRRMLTDSHDGVASALWAAGGGREIVQDMTERIGLRDTSVPSRPDEWEMTRISAQDVVRIYEFIEHQLPEPSRDLIVEALAATPERAADGFAQRFGIADALPGTEWAVKQGWMRAANSLVLHSTGLVGADERYVVVLLTHLPGRTSFETGRAAVTAGVAALAGSLD